MRSKFPLAILGLSFFSMGFGLPETQTHYPEFKPHMQAVYSSLVQVMPLYLQGDTPVTAKDQARLEVQFKNLAEQSKAIQVIAEKSDAGHKALATQLATYTEAAYTQFRAGKANQTRFFLSDTLNTCFDCHTSRGTESDSAFIKNFNRDLKWETFDPLARARFLALSRQFDKSLGEYEKLLLDSKLSLDDLANIEPFVEYMILGIRVKNSPDEVLATLAKIKTENLPELVKNDIKNWTKSLEQLKKEKISGNTLAEAKKQMTRARQSMEYPQDRSGLVRMIVASRILHELVLDKKISAKEKAETYYLLGLAENVIGSEFFSDETLAYFEETVKLAPKTDMAKKAFAQYEDILLFNFSGSGGTKIPDAEARRLKELKQQAF